MAVLAPERRNGRTLEIKPLETTRFVMRIEGTTPLITDAFSDAAKAALALSQSGAPRDKLNARDPEAEFARAQYVRSDGTYGIPKLAFRVAIKTAAMRMSQVKGTAMLAAFIIDTPDELLPLVTTEPKMRIDHVVRVGRGNLAYRAEFWPWSVSIPVTLHEPVVSLAEFIDVVNKAGIGVGVGNWRPEKDGDHGTFTVTEVTNRE